ncbi:MAG: DUF5110 domain-containing protein [Phycisphaerales bacterium]|nr:DUF5110 domain-containing protein [Phycisphaerales bacterium]
MLYRPFLPRVLAASSLLVMAAGLAQAQIVSSLSQNIWRIDASEEARDHALPSLSFADPGAREKFTPAVAPPREVPTFDRDASGKVRVHLEIDPGTSLYGTGEVPGPLLRNGRTSVNWNTDSYGYGIDTPSLYQSHPWVLGVRADGSAFGVLADTTWRTAIDLTQGITIVADGPEFPVIVFEAPHPEMVVRRLTQLIGRIDLPPLWALGYHQCRYSYFPDARVREIAREFRERKIPCDVIWMDIDYMKGYRCFTFDDQHFPDPAALNADLHTQGFHTVWMIDPGIKAEPGYSVFDQGSGAEAWVQASDKSTPFKGEVWPGACVFPDFTSAAVRAWWAGLYKDFLAKGIDGVWNDMNEPAVFKVESKTMPEDNWHRADDALGGPGPHAQYHNVYGMLMVKATREGVLAANPDKRPFVLSRASFTGGHRYGAAWTGDNVADWTHLDWSIPMTLNLGLSGQPFAGPDIGGFVGNGDAALYKRWIGIGALLPFARGHTGKENIDKEPWAFGPEVEATARRGIERRYVLMPYIYSLFWKASKTGSPVVMPVFFADPANPDLRAEDDAFLLGDAMLVRCRTTPGADREPAMPRGLWRKFDLRDRIPGDHTDPDLPELYIRGGTIIPSGPVMQHTGATPLEPLTLIVCPDLNGRAQGGMYEDAGEGFAYRAGATRVVGYAVTRTREGVYVLRRTAEEGEYKPGPRSIRVVLVTDEGMFSAQGLDGVSIEIDPAKARRID